MTEHNLRPLRNHFFNLVGFPSEHKNFLLSLFMCPYVQRYYPHSLSHCLVWPPRGLIRSDPTVPPESRVYWKSKIPPSCLSNLIMYSVLCSSEFRRHHSSNGTPTRIYGPVRFSRFRYLPWPPMWRRETDPPTCIRQRRVPEVHYIRVRTLGVLTDRTVESNNKEINERTNRIYFTISKSPHPLGENFVSGVIQSRGCMERYPTGVVPSWHTEKNVSKTNI